MKSEVALSQGKSREESIGNCLNLLGERLKKTISQKERIVIKPNFVSNSNKDANTRVESTRTLLDFIKKITRKKITIAEGSFHKTFKDFKTFGYFDLAKDHNLEFIDLNKDETVEAEIYDRNLKPTKAKIAKTIADSDFRISITPAKTHDAVAVTLGLKNMVVGALRGRAVFGRHIRANIHSNYQSINLSLFKLAKIIPPHLTIIDAWDVMEGEGPVAGELVPMHLALASFDFLAVDSLIARLMGFDPDEVGYLHYCQQADLGESDLDQLEIIGVADWRNYKRNLTPHPNFENQLNWRVANEQEFLTRI